jgi:hypothetical protein
MVVSDYMVCMKKQDQVHNHAKHMTNSKSNLDLVPMVIPGILLGISGPKL